MNNIVTLQFYQLLLAYFFVIALLIIVKFKGISREKEIVLASIRMTLQLILAGNVLIYLFQNPSPIFTLIILVVMLSFSIYNIIKRSKTPLSRKLKKIIALSMVIGTTSSIFYFLLVVLSISPWYNPRYFIPITGMLIGNSMTGISLGVNTLVSQMHNQKYLIEGSLMLGATPKNATKHIVNNSFDSAILPTLNSMLGMGIVFLPGMMTGQILSGISPITAIYYQIAIMLGILGSVSFTVIIFVQLSYKTFFNEQSQLVLN